MDIRRAGLTMARWRQLIDDAYRGQITEPITNIDESRGSHYDAIFLGGGSAGRFGAAVLRSLGGRALVLERWPFLGGSCPHQACVPHHLFSEAAKELDQAQALAGRLWYGRFDPDAASILELVELFRSQRSGPHAHMNWQSTQQLDIEYILNAPAQAADATTVQVAGRTFTADALVLCTGSRTAMPGIPGETLPGVFDYASFIEELDYEPARIVVIGGSKVAVEYASFYRATGTPTTIVSRGTLLSTGGPGRMDDDLRRFVVDGMQVRGVGLLERSTVSRITGDERVEAVEVTTPDGPKRIEADFVLIATGERPNVESFISALPAERDGDGFVTVNSRMQTSIPGVYAAGDLLGPPLEMFKSRRSGTTAARNIMGTRQRVPLRRHPGLPAHDLRSQLGGAQRARGQADGRSCDDHPAAAAGPDTGRDPAADGRGINDLRVHHARADRLPEVRARCALTPRAWHPSRRIRRQGRLPVPAPSD